MSGANDGRDHPSSGHIYNGMPSTNYSQPTSQSPYAWYGAQASNRAAMMSSMHAKPSSTKAQPSLARNGYHFVISNPESTGKSSYYNDYREESKRESETPVQRPPVGLPISALVPTLYPLQGSDFKVPQGFTPTFNSTKRLSYGASSQTGPRDSIGLTPFLVPTPPQASLGDSSPTGGIPGNTNASISFRKTDTPLLTKPGLLPPSSFSAHHRTSGNFSREIHRDDIDLLLQIRNETRRPSISPPTHRYQVHPIHKENTVPPPQNVHGKPPLAPPPLVMPVKQEDPHKPKVYPKSCFPAKVPKKYPTRLALPGDVIKLNSLHQLVRSDLLEIFVIDPDNPLSVKFRNTPTSSVGRVGFRCAHCFLARKEKPGREDEAPMAVFYPKSLKDIYRLVTSWQRCHVRKCKNLPPTIRKEWDELRSKDKTRGKTSYWAESAYEIGLRECPSLAGGLFFDLPDVEE